MEKRLVDELLRHCLWCKREFKRRPDAKFCSGTCRQSFWVNDATQKRRLGRGQLVKTDKALLRRIVYDQTYELSKLGASRLDRLIK